MGVAALPASFVSLVASCQRHAQRRNRHALAMALSEWPFFNVLAGNVEIATTIQGGQRLDAGTLSPG